MVAAAGEEGEGGCLLSTSAGRDEGVLGKGTRAGRKGEDGDEEEEKEEEDVEA